MPHAERRTSILTRFALFTLVALAIAAMISFLVGEFNNRILENQKNSLSADYVQAELQDYLSTLYSPDLFASTENPDYQTLELIMTYLCRDCDAEHLYLYKVNEERTERTYLIVVSDEEHEHAAGETTLESGRVTTTPLSEEELRALDHQTVDSPEAVDNEFGHDYCWYRTLELPDGGGTIIMGLDYDMDLFGITVSQAALSFSIPMIVAIVCVAAYELVVLKRNIVTPIRTLSTCMRTFVQEGTHVKEPLKKLRNDEIGEITDSFNYMASEIERHVSRIEEMTEERVAATTELQVARRIQQGLIPANSRFEEPCLGLEIQGFARTARAVGGDFYDMGELDNGNPFFVIADVSGKGISAALFMAMCRTLIHDRLQSGLSPAEALNAANDSIVSNNPENMFVTAIVCCYNPNNHTLTYANAGHTPPLVVGGGYLAPDPGIALGLFEDADIVDETIVLERGQGVLLYTDGATEAINAQMEFFGEARLETAVAHAHTAQEAVDGAVRAVDGFVGDAEQFDDLTLVSFFLQEPTAHHWKASLAPKLENFNQINVHLVALCGGKAAAMMPILACEEMYTNVVNYSGATLIKVSIERKENQVWVSLVDNGIAFDPLSKEDEEREFEDLAYGGMGISLVKQSCSELTYEYRNNKNLLTMCFEL